MIDRGRVVALGSPADLVAEHAPEQEVLFTVPDGSGLAAVEGLGGVLASESRSLPEGGVRVRVRTTEPDRVLAAVLGRGLEVSRVRTRDSGLEDVFRRVTGRGFDEDAAPAGKAT